jgi:hypothetical protein
MKWKKRLTGWYRWFAWYPVEVNGYIVWLEYVERLWYTNWWEMYRFPERIEK